MIYIISDINYELLSRSSKDIKVLSKTFIEIIQFSKGELKIKDKINPTEDILTISLSSYALLKIFENKENISTKDIKEFFQKFIEILKQNIGFEYFLISNPFNLIFAENKSLSLPVKNINISRQFLLKYQLAIEEIIQNEEKISKFDISDLSQIKSTKSLKQYLFTSTYVDYNNYQQITNRIRESANFLKIEIFKVLALDLDNTLWGGILREDGKENLIICGHHPQGELYKIIQQLFKDLKDAGILLALVTKNNHNDVVEAFNFNNFMPLQINDFVSVKASDLPKSQLIKQLSNELNINLKHFIFIDDSSFERREVKENASDVHVLDLPENNYDWLKTILSDIHFSKTLESTSFSNKKNDRTEKYIARKKRFELKHSLEDQNDYYKTWIKKLNQKLTFKILKKPTNRTVELFSRTNQFNSCGNKYSFNQLNNMLNENHKIIEISLKDNYGDEGVISVLILKENNKEIVIDDFIMSCRVFGRYVEEIILSSLPSLFGENKSKFTIKLAYNSNGKNIKSSEFIKKFTDKNGLLISDDFNKDIAESTVVNFDVS